MTTEVTGRHDVSDGAGRLAVCDVCVRFDTAAVLTGAHLALDAGEVVALLGPSGSGKSTLLRVIAGLIRPERGTVEIDGTDVTRLPTHRRGVGMVFQDEQLFDHLDVTANVAYGLKMAGAPARSRSRRVDELLSLVGLTGLGGRDVTTLSGGEAKRVALARSLAPRPKVLLLDEPLTGLDRDLHDRLAADLGRILREERTTSLLVTHDRDEAATIADRVVTIADVMDADDDFVVTPVAVAEVHDLRRRVLRRGTPNDRVDFSGDDDPLTRHLAVRDAAGDVIATSTWSEQECPDRPSRRGLQLRGMAVDDAWQRRGLGAVLLAAGLDLAASRGIDVVWANARDTAVDFYVGHGFAVVGDGFVTPDTGLPHHRVLHEG